MKHLEALALGMLTLLVVGLFCALIAALVQFLNVHPIGAYVLAGVTLSYIIGLAILCKTTTTFTGGG